MQFGFRGNRSTVDCVFILHTLVQRLLSEKKHLYCAFIDYEKAFDSISRDTLWYKLFEIGVSTKMLNMLKSLYNQVSACVKSYSNISDFFDVSLGLKQGEPLSPILFILFVNDVSVNLDFNSLTESDLNYLNIYMLLFADDMILFTTNPQSLQAQLDSLYVYSFKWGLKINVNKTKICVFRKTKTLIEQNWYINNEEVEKVDSFCYLGVNFNYNGSMQNAMKSLSDQALRAVNSLYSIFYRMEFNVKTKLILFDRMVQPILYYCAEVFGIYNTNILDRIQIKFYKKILGVKPATPNMAVLGELGCYPISIKCKERVLKYWFKLNYNRESLMHNMFSLQYADRYNNRCTFWAKHVKSLIENLGYGYMWHNFDTNITLEMLHDRLRCQFLQEWSNSVRNMSKLDYYIRFKQNFVMKNI